MTEPYIRAAHYADLVPFAAVLDDHRFLAERLDRQRNGLGVLFVAWLRSRPAGDVYLWLEEAEEEPIRRHLPGVALITHLRVHGELRNRGVGQALIAAVEQHLTEHGHDRVALAVRTDNPSAARLYERLGYADWGHGEVTCYARTHLPGGEVLEEPEECHVLAKNLVRPVPAPRSASWSLGVSRPP